MKVIQLKFFYEGNKCTELSDKKAEIKLLEYVI